MCAFVAAGGCECSDRRLSSPLYPFVFILIVVAFVGQAQSTRQNRVQLTATGFLVAASFRVAGMATNNIVVLNANAVPLLYIIPVSGIALGLILILAPASTRRATALVEHMTDAVTQLFETIWNVLSKPRRTAGNPQ